jgi:hypothetical protein
MSPLRSFIGWIIWKNAIAGEKSCLVRMEGRQMRKNLRWQQWKAHSRLFVASTAVLSGFFLLTMMNEVLDVPHYLFGDAPTSWEQRKGEVVLETVVYAMIILVAVFCYNRLQKRISILEGMLPICSSCKKIRQDKDWVVLEEYISSHSLADFSHGLCPECMRELYPEYGNVIIAELKTKGSG